MKIESIKKTSGNKYKIKFDNGETLSLEDQVIIDYNILFKKEIDNDLIFELNKANEKYEVYNKVVKYIMKKMRSQKEIEKYIEKYDLSKEEKDVIFDKLRSINLLNHELYAVSYVADKINLSKEGPLKIRKDLEEKGIEREYIDNALKKYDLIERLNKMVLLFQKKVNNNKKYSNNELKKRFISELDRLGYSRDFTLECLNKITFSNNDIIKKEYDKLYTKLSKKYNGNELNYKIKGKLFQKGFSSEEINNIINEY